MNTQVNAQAAKELTPDEALKRLKDLDEEAKAREQERANILAALRVKDLETAVALVRRHGFTAKELGLVAPASAPAAHAPAQSREPKYMNPEAPHQTWGGGGNPKWVVDAKAKGLKLEDLAIEKVKAKLIAEGKMNEDGTLKQ